MRAAVLSAPGLDNLRVKDLPVPVPPEGWVRIRVMAFGLNRSEYHSVTGQAEGMTYPRVLGIEAAGVIDLDPAGELAPGTQAATMMGGMGRAFDGGYAQYVVVPRAQVLTFSCDLPWPVIGSVPETLQTAYGSLTTGLDAYDGGKSHEHENEKGLELHGHIENLAKLRESALSLRHSAIEDVVARQKRDGDEDDG